MRTGRVMGHTIGIVASVGASVIVASAGIAHAEPQVPPNPSQDSAEWWVTDGYFTKQIGCTPNTPGNPLSITWDWPGFVPAIGGAGMINDASPALGGHFTTHWVPVPGYWDTQYEFC